MNKRHRQILDALEKLGGRASLGEIANKAGLNTNGVSQSMNASSFRGRMRLVPSPERGRDRIYEIVSGGQVS